MHLPHPDPAFRARRSRGRASSPHRSHEHPRAIRILSVVTLALTTAASSLRAAETFQYIGRLGDSLTAINEAGYTLGSLEGATGESFQGQIAVLGDPSGRLTRVGLYDARHTGAGPKWTSSAMALNAHGLSIGGSVLYWDNLPTGESAWVADRTGRVLRLGLFDTAHTRPDGSQYSRTVALNDRNEVIGYSLGRHGYSATSWLTSPTLGYVRLGLMDAAHTAPEGYRASQPVAINKTGHVAGNSTLFVEGAWQHGSTPWIRMPWGKNRIIGLQGGIHRDASGLHLGWVNTLNDSGYAAGQSLRFKPGTEQEWGQTAWLTHVDRPNYQVGLYDSRHQTASGYADTQIWFVNASGYAVGRSYQLQQHSPDYRPSFVGASAWLARPDGSTIRIGLYGPEYTGSRGQWNLPTQITDDGLVAGFAHRYHPTTGADLGPRAWLYEISTGAITTIGPTGPEYTRDDGYSSSSIWSSPWPGHIIGASYRYDIQPAGSRYSTWVYDLVDGSLVVLNDLADPDGEHPGNRVGVDFVDTDGTIFGSYDTLEWGVGIRAFVYSKADGFRYLDESVDADITQDGWLKFGRVRKVTRSGFIVGTGFVEGSTSSDGPVFLLRRRR